MNQWAKHCTRRGPIQPTGVRGYQCGCNGTALYVFLLRSRASATDQARAEISCRERWKNDEGEECERRIRRGTRGWLSARYKACGEKHLVASDWPAPDVALGKSDQEGRSGPSIDNLDSERAQESRTSINFSPVHTPTGAHAGIYTLLDPGPGKASPASPSSLSSCSTPAMSKSKFNEIPIPLPPNADYKQQSIAVPGSERPGVSRECRFALRVTARG